MHNFSSDQMMTQARLQMVERQLKRRDVEDPAVLEAMRRVPRHLFVPTDLVAEAYDDTPLPIGHGQTISQPYIVASMTEKLQPSKDKHVLEIGTGSGYQTAVLAELFGRIDTVEIVPELFVQARSILSELGYTNINFHNGDGLKIPVKPKAFDGIIVTAAPERFPESLVERLAVGGRLIIPVGHSHQNLMLVVKERIDKVTRRELYPVRFVTLQTRD